VIVKSNLVKIIECPRDAWQGLNAKIPTALKADYLTRLVGAGFTHIDAASFVSPIVVPQMADSEDVLQLLEPNARVEIIGIVVNHKGAERAINTGKVQTLGFPYSISRAFLRRNQHQTPEGAQAILEEIATLAYDAGLGLVAYVSMAFGNPYGELWDVDQVVSACDLLAASGVLHVSLADTVGLASSEQVSEVFAATQAAHPEIELGVHLHARPEEADAKVRAAYEAGCRRFDSAIGGLGGCPFAQDTLVGNIPTERLIETLSALGATLPDLRLDDSLIRANSEITQQFSPSFSSSIG
jgi:hydroxymethylglutaryl-CoA lyase